MSGGGQLRPASTIYALSTAQGRAGIAVVRVSGPTVVDVIETIIGHVPPPRRAQFATLRHVGDVIDTGLVLFFPAPLSFTGEDTVEFHVHGSQAVIARLFRAFADFPDVRLAEPGEYTRRALIAGKIDLVGAEALADLIDSETEQQRRLAINGQAGGLQTELCALRAALIEARALVEAGIDFSDEGDVPAMMQEQLLVSARNVLQKLETMMSASKNVERIRAGFNVVLTGNVNAGKSTLLNALAGRDAAIVSPRPGTTRDVIEIALDLNGWPVRLVDTAGLRETDDDVELEGIRRTETALQDADLILHLSRYDFWPVLPAVYQARVLQVRTQIDSLPTSLPAGLLSISALTGEGIPHLLHMIEEGFPKDLLLEHQVVVFRERQRRCLLAATQALKRVDTFAEPELIAENLRLAADSLGQLIGDIVPDEILGEIFGRFCIGK